MSFQIQQQIKQNAHEIREYVSDLYEWEEEMALKQKAKQNLIKENQKAQLLQKNNTNVTSSYSHLSPQSTSQLRQNKHQQKKYGNNQTKTQQNQPKPKKELIRDVNTVQEYYKAWDKFDVDQQIKKLQQDELRPYRPYNPYENSKNYIRAKPKTQVNINIKGKRAVVIDPSQLKDKGNLHYKVCQYEKAIDAYTQCLQKLEQQEYNEANNKLRAVVLSNRAMTYMKINQRAKGLHDCNQSLKFDHKYGKSYLRRADCHRKLGNYKQSLRDYRKVKQLDPSDKQSEAQIKRIQLFLQKQCKQARQSLVVSNIMKVIPDSYRIPIQEVEELPLKQLNYNREKSETKPNYLQEL